jgi:zinc protease
MIGIVKPRLFVTLAIVLVLTGSTAIMTSSCKSKGARVSKISSLPKLEYEKYRLANGLEVIMLEDHRLPMVAVNIWYHVGPANERPGLTGFAHLFEHMMFEGSKYVGEKAHFQYLEAAGASEINGTTDFDRTNYFETLPSNQVELALWLESDRMGFLLDQLDEKKLKNQRDVVRNERRQSVEGSPYGLVQEEMFHQLYPKNHPYYASVIGSHADIEAAHLSDVRDFFRLYYAPNNASLAIVGNIDKAKIKALVEKYFGPILSGPPIPKVSITTPPITSERRAVVTDQVELPRVYMAWITDPILTQGDAECDMIAKILGGGKCSRLYKKLVYEKRIAQDVSAYQYSLALGSLFSIESTAKPGIKLEELEKAIDEELASFRAQGPTAAELEGARNTIESSVIRGLETLGGFGGVADRLNQYNHYLGDPGYLDKDLGRYSKATLESLRQKADGVLRTQARVVVFGVPGKKVIDDAAKSAPPSKSIMVEALPTSNQDWRKSPPQPGPISRLTLPVPLTFKLSNGLSVYLIEQHSLPIVSANVIVLSGSERNPANRPGLASFAAEMLDEGTQKRSALQIAVDADRLGTSLYTGSSMDLSFVSFRSLKKNADGAFELMSDILLNPAFPMEEIERIRNDRITDILQQKDNPNITAAKIFSNVVYGQNHPYGYTDLGTEESNKVLTREDLYQFWKEGYVPVNSALVLAGDITKAEARALAEKHLGNWSGVPSESRSMATPQNSARRIILVQKNDSPQSAIRIGHVGVARSNPDYVPIDVMNTELGGLFSSRINLNLREKHGYTYGASSVFAFRRGAGPFIIGTSVHTESTAASVTEIFREVERMRSEEIALQELATAKDSISRSLPGLFETTPQAASSIGQLFVYNLPPDYYRSLPKRIDSVTAADVKQMAQRYLKPEEMVVVIVGEIKKIKPEIEKLNLGPVEIRDENGNLIK